VELVMQKTIPAISPTRVYNVDSVLLTDAKGGRTRGFTPFRTEVRVRGPADLPKFRIVKTSLSFEISGPHTSQPPGMYQVGYDEPFHLISEADSSAPVIFAGIVTLAANREEKSENNGLFAVLHPDQPAGPQPGIELSTTQRSDADGKWVMDARIHVPSASMERYWFVNFLDVWAVNQNLQMTRHRIMQNGNLGYGFMLY
jgi:hypothetical protein